MEEQHLKKVVFHTFEDYYEDNGKNLTYFIGLLENSRQEAPEEYRNDVKIEFYTKGYEEAYICIDFYYERPETEEEKAIRIKWELHKKQIKEDELRDQYNRLKELFEGKNNA